MNSPLETTTLSPAARNDSSASDVDGRRTPLKFKPIRLCDLPLINSILQDSLSRTCDYTTGGIFMWIGYFGYEYCVVDDTLFIKGLAQNDRSVTAFSLPIGPMPLEKSVEMIRDYCSAEGIRPVFSAIPEDKIDYLTAVVPGIPEELGDWGDYLYSADALANLTGKALSKKRNHVNRFMADNPAYSFEPLDRNNISDARLFLDRLDNENEKSDPGMADYEKRQCDAVLRDFYSYPFEGAVLRDDNGRIVAFTVGEVIGDTLYVHIEKMDHTVAGSGETINKLFASHMLLRHPAIRFINREDASGDPGLQKAKESYHPIAVLRKFNLTAD